MQTVDPPACSSDSMYPQGYFRQRVTTDGWQEEVYEQLDWTQAPIVVARTIDAKPCVILVPLAERSVLVQVWEVQLGRVRLFLLDTDLPQNSPADRELSARLYGGGKDTRVQQEIILGFGGVLALRALGLQPAAWHLNEGHAAFVVLQRMRDFLAAGLTWDDALAEVRRTTVFTTHTPVPAGHDAFPFPLVEQHLSACWGSMNGHGEMFMALGSYDNGQGLQFNMQLRDITPAIARDLGLPANRTGAVISSVDPAGSAFRAGLQTGDVIVAIDGNAVTSVDQVSASLDKVPVAQSVRVIYMRDGQEGLAVIRKR